MHLIPILLVAIVSGSSLVLSAPVNQTDVDSLRAKQQKATEIAGRLLKQMADEQTASHHQQAKVQVDENKDKSTEEDDDDDFGYYPTIDILNKYFEDRYEPSTDDLYRYVDAHYKPTFEFEGEPLSENELFDEDQEIYPSPYPFFNQQWDEQDESNENNKPFVHTQVLDDSVMNAEEHKQQQRRRRSSH